MYITEELRKELDFFRRSNENFEIEAGKSTCKVEAASDDVLYMAMSASLVMDCYEEGFFENFFITDKKISGKDDMLIDAYALIETDNSNIKQLHIFQYKLYDNDRHGASPVELLQFSTFVNNSFVHPEWQDKASNNEVVKEIKSKCDEFLGKRRGRSITTFAHYINNAKGIYNDNAKDIEGIIGRFERDRQLLGFSVQVYGLKDIMDLAKDGKIQIGSESLEMVNDEMYSYRLEDNSKRESLGLPKKVIIGMCNVNEFIRLQNKYHHNQLYSENIRLYLGDRGNVNNDIIRTITSAESLWFPYMNNGISIICDELTLGSVNEKKHIRPLLLKNMQIINGCQTVNALYSAKYGEDTRDNFRAANVMVRIYEIDAAQTDFKMNIIKATNNQNAVKSFSLVANDPIQVAISEVLKRFNIVYDRKGEGKEAGKDQLIISMVNVALAYRAVYLRMARSLRSGLGKSRVFQKKEYEQIFKPELLDEGQETAFHELCFKLIVANQILESIRKLIQENDANYTAQLPIFRKSAYYLAGYFYAWEKEVFDDITHRMQDAYEQGNDLRLRGENFPQKVEVAVRQHFDEGIDNFIRFYNTLQGIDKTDIDNLLKSTAFDKAYQQEITKLAGETAINETEE